jgi:DNA-binding protein YbaB
MSPNDHNNWVCKVYVNSLVSMSETSCVSVRLIGKKNSNQLNIDETFIDRNDVA